MVKTVSDEKTAPDLRTMNLCACRSCGDLAPLAIAEIDRLRAALNDAVAGWRSATCEGERCVLCGEPASAKIGEEIAVDDPAPARHNVTAYVCGRHFVQLFGVVGRRLMTR